VVNYEKGKAMDILTEAKEKVMVKFAGNIDKNSSLNNDEAVRVLLVGDCSGRESRFSTWNDEAITVIGKVSAGDEEALYRIPPNFRWSSHLESNYCSSRKEVIEM